MQNIMIFIFFMIRMCLETGIPQSIL